LLLASLPSLYVLSHFPRKRPNVSLVAQKAEELEKEEAESGKPLEHGIDPAIPYWQACTIMTRSDFIQALDHENISKLTANPS
jgi:hypothetical protein